MLPKVTEETVEAAMEGFPLQLEPGKDWIWLGTAVRRALAITVPSASDAPDRTSNSDIRAELERLSTLAGSTWLELFDRDHAANSRLWSHAWFTWDGEGGKELGDGIIAGEPSDYRRFNAALRELDWMASFLRQAANATPSQSGPWRQSEAKQIRIERGQYLAPIFEFAFGEKASANNHPTDTRIKAPTHFMDFYKRMVSLAFGERELSNLTEVVKESCRRHRQHPAKFGKGMIAGLS